MDFTKSKMDTEFRIGNYNLLWWNIGELGECNMENLVFNVYLAFRTLFSMEACG